MRVGTMMMPIEFQTYAESYDALNQPIEDWEHFCKGFGKPVHENQIRRWSNAQIQAEGNMVLETRFNPSLLARLRTDIESMRAKSGDRVFEIHNYIDPDERKKRIHLLVKEVM